MRVNLLYLIIAFFLSFIFFFIAIPLLKKDKITQHIREEGPKSHFAKSGTPTGGGIVFLIVPLFFVSLFANKEFIFIYLSFLLNGAIGFIDDFMSVSKKRSLGLTARGKIVLQFAVAFVLYFIGRPLFSSTVSIGNFSLNIGNTGYFFLYLFVMLGSTNAFNLTDGIDGLSTIVSIPIFVSFAIIGGVLIKNVSFVMLGMLLAYLWFNSPKASVFMGDTGALALGGVVAAMSFVSKSEILLAFFAVIPVIEAISVILQVSYFKITHGKRIFKMAPIHHHFELSGWSEAQIDFRFFIITVLSCILGIIVNGGI